LSHYFPKKSWTGSLLSLLAGAGLTLCFSPFELWWLAPLLIALQFELVNAHHLTKQVSLLRFYLFAVGMYATGISWIFVSINRYGGASELLAGFLVLLFVLAYSLHGALQGYVYAWWLRSSKVWIDMLGFSGLWVLQEWTRTWLLTGFPWLLLGYSQLESPLAGWATLGGVLGLSLLTVVMGMLLWWLIRQILFGIRRRHLNISVIVRGSGVIALLLVMFFIGNLLKVNPFVKEGSEQISVSIVQGNIAQEVKWRREMVRPILDLYRDATRSELGRELVVWPEAAITLFREQAEAELSTLSRQAKRRGTTIVTGVPDRQVDGGFLNTAVALGNGEGQYIKRRLVPFGEYVPLENLLRGLIKFFDLPMSRNLSGPEEQPALQVGDYRASLSICYEVVYSELVRSTTPDPDFYITISNDTWFGESIGPWQHLQMARMRALENGRYLVRATNNGLSVLVNYRGEVTQALPQFETGVLRGNINIVSGETPFHRLGQWPVLLLASLLIAAALLLKSVRYPT